ncbi:MAG: SMC family ATPase [Gemmatimonadetes bacterium]|nr:SMC family ATPase [Gemmatimonadota bacterium]
MQLHRLKLVNFRQHAETEMKLGPGLTAVVGPNGSGKTTLIEAIGWVLYGNVAARGSRDSLRRLSAPARAPVRVELDFALGPHEYRITRSLYGAELYQDGGEGPVANSHQAVSSKIEHLLGMTHDEFFSTYFTGQKELAVMASMGPTERAKFLSRLLGYEKLRQAQGHLRQRRSTLRAELSGLEQGLEGLEGLQRERADARESLKDVKTRMVEISEEMERAKRASQDLGPMWTEMKALREANLAADGERRIAEQAVLQARREFDRIDRQLADALTARNQLEELQPDLDRAQAVRAELERLDREAQVAGRRRSLSGQLTEVRQQTERVLQRVAAMADVGAEHENAKSALDKARATLDELRRHEEARHTAWVSNRQDAETKRLGLLDQYKDLATHRKRILEAGADGQCPTCARPLGPEYESVLATLAAQLEEIKSNGKFYKARVKQLASEPEEVQASQRERKTAGKELEDRLRRTAESDANVRQHQQAQCDLGRLQGHLRALETELAGLSDEYDAELHDSVRKEMKRLEPSVQVAAQLHVRAEHAERLVTDAEQAEQSLSAREEHLEQLAEAIAASGYTEDGYAQARKQHESAEAVFRDVELRAATLKGDGRAAAAALESVERRIGERAERATRAVAVRTDLTLHDELDTALEDLRGELNAKLRPDLSELASRFVVDLTDGRYQEFELDEQYRITVLEDGLPKPVISGGEDDVLNLALRLAISQMVADRAGQPLSLLVLDEIFGGLDDSRRRLVVDLLRRLSDRFPQVVLITHIESVKEGADQVWRVALDTRAQAAVVTEESSMEQHVPATV